MISAVDCSERYEHIKRETNHLDLLTRGARDVKNYTGYVNFFKAEGDTPTPPKGENSAKKGNSRHADSQLIASIEITFKINIL
jgi:hypothetical protein